MALLLMMHHHVKFWQIHENFSSKGFEQNMLVEL